MKIDLCMDELTIWVRNDHIHLLDMQLDYTGRLTRTPWTLHQHQQLLSFHMQYSTHFTSLF